MSWFLLYLLYAFVQAVLIVRTDRYMRKSAEVFVPVLIIFAPLAALAIAVIGVVATVQWLCNVGIKD